MNLRLAALAITSALSLLLPISASVADESPDPQIDYLVPEIPPIAPPPGPCGTASCEDLFRYLRALPPDVLIDIVFDGTGAASKMKAIARRESGLGRSTPVPFDPACSARNRRSSASGLFQTLYLWNGTAVANGLSWANVAGPDCLDDVLLARAIWNRSGFHPWRV